MKQLIIFITLLVVTLPQLCFAEDEVIWETEKIGGLNEVQVSPLGGLLYNTNDSIVQVRNIEDGKLIDEIIFSNTTRLDHISISANGRYMAVSGQTKYVIIYDLQERREVKRITTIAYEREEYGNMVIYDTEHWLSSSISPDGLRIVGIVANGPADDRTRFVVIDIASEEVLFSQQRITYDHFSPDKYYHQWHTTEYSPDGSFIVNQLEFKGADHPNSADSVYIFDANTFEIDNVLLNSYSGNTEIEFSRTDNLISTSHGRDLILYNLQDKQSIYISLEQSPKNIVFPMKENKIVLRIGTSTALIYDYNLKKIVNTMPYRGLPKTSTKDNDLIYFGMDHNIALIKPDWNKITSIEDNENEIIISPNPTNGLVNITLDCQSPKIKYQINNTSGQNLESKVIANTNNSLVINFNSYPFGIYYLTIECNMQPKTYKIVKEG